MVPLGLMPGPAASATDAAIQKKILRSGTTPVFSNKEIDDIIKYLSLLRMLVC